MPTSSKKLMYFKVILVSQNTVASLQMKTRLESHRDVREMFVLFLISSSFYVSASFVYLVYVLLKRAPLYI